SRRRHTRCLSDWSSDVCSSDLGFIEDIIELDYGRNLQVPVFKCKWARVPNGVEVDNYGFTIVDLNVAGYKNDPWILADNVAQVRSEERRVGKESESRRSLGRGN